MMATVTSKFINLVNSEDDTDRNEGQNEKPKFVPTANANLYLVDARKRMFDVEEESMFIKMAFECITSCLRKKIYSMENSFCGVGLVGTDKSNNHLNLKNITMLSEIKKLGAEQVKSCLDVIEVIKKENFDKTYGHGNFSLADLFLFSSKAFSEAVKNMKCNKCIILFSNDDNPHVNQNDEIRRSITNAKDLSLHSIDFDIVQMGKQFNVNLFYKEIIQEIKNVSDYQLPAPVVNMSQMMDRIVKVNYRRVSMVKIPFIISDDFKIGVTVHHLIRKVKPPYKVKLSKSTNELVTTKMQLFDEETGEVVDDDNVEKYETICGQEIKFNPKELNEIKSMGERGLKLMGFKPSSTIHLDHFVKQSAFIYPDESYCKGSKLFLCTLLKRCKAKDKVAICTYYPRPTSNVRFVALVPMEEVRNEENVQVSPCGFIVVFLPFADEVRHLDDKCSGKKRANEQEVSLAQKIVKRLTFMYTPSCFSNPKIRQHWAAIDALALNLEEAEEIIDNTVPDYELFEKRLKSLPSEFKNQIYGEEYDPELSSKPAKKPKIVVEKTVVPEPSIDVTYIEELARNNELTKLKVDQLKSYLSAVNVKGISKMKKADMIDIICKRLDLDSN